MKSIVKPYLIISLFLLSALISCEKSKENVVEERVCIIDNAKLLDFAQKEALTNSIRDFEDKLGPQLTVITLETLAGVKIEEYTYTMFDELNLGRDGINDGLIIAVAMKEKKIRIAVGTGLEKIIKDEIAAQYIRVYIKPNFQEKKYYEAFSEVVLQIERTIEEDKNLIGVPL